MQKPNNPSNLTREAVLAELADLAEGRHPDCQTVTARFMRSEEWKQASIILRSAIQAESCHRRHGEIAPPSGWLLPV